MQPSAFSRAFRYVGPLLLLLPLAEPGPAGATFTGDNGKIVFTGTEKGNERDILKVDPQAGPLVPITDTKHDDRDPAVSPNGKRVAFTRSAGMEQPQIFIAKLNGAFDGSHRDRGDPGSLLGPRAVRP